MPSILIEAGFISNPDEEKYLNTEEGITYMASAIYRAFRDYKKAFEADNLTSGDEDFNIVESIEETEDNSEDNENQDENSNEQENTNITFPSDNTENAEIVFRVQIGASSESCQNFTEKYPEITDVWEYFHMGLYKHTAGKTSNYQKIVNLQNKLRGQYPDCFVVAFKKDSRITIRDALNELGD
jgi:N-acetylmuramoyl-L-alanine amidase